MDREANYPIEEGIMEKPLFSKDRLKRRFGSYARVFEPMIRHTSLGVGGPADIYIQARTRQDLDSAMALARQADLPWFVIGRGTNLLVPDAGIQGMVIALDGIFSRVGVLEQDQSRGLVRAGAGAGLPALCRFAAQNGFSGMNFATGIPGSVGGALVMNAGTDTGEMARVVLCLTLLTREGKILKLQKEDVNWAYRKSSLPEDLVDEKGRAPIILDAVFEFGIKDPDSLVREQEHILSQRKKKQPLNKKSAGSFFKNPPEGPSAGALIDSAGLKGKKIGGAMVSPVHANFIINEKDATASDILALARLVQEEVKNKTGIRLEAEVHILGA